MVAGAEADGGARREEEPGGKGKRGEVLEDRKLTRSAMERSGRQGEVGGGRNHPRRPAAGVGEDGHGAAKFVTSRASQHERMEEEVEKITAVLRSVSPVQGIARSGRNRQTAEARVSGWGERRGEDGVA